MIRFLIRLLVCFLPIGLSACAQVSYYAQAAQGQYQILAYARPIDDWIAAPDTAPKLRDKLLQVKQIRVFAVSELGLPDNGSYKRYTDLKRPFVLWNVVAAPELSLKPRQWCFPVAGCVDYRGYYSKDDAQAYAAQLRTEGFDVQVSGVPAYSTLGWFDDPVLSSFIQYPDAELARLIFHELAHQVAYAKGDSQFNESFATAVEEVGVEQWLRQKGDEKLRSEYAIHDSRKRDFLALLLKYRERLSDNYEREASDADKLAEKKKLFQGLQDDYQLLKRQWGGYTGYDRWFAEPLSNAHLALVATYHEFVPAFRALRDQSADLPAFYEAVRQLAKLDQEERRARLQRLTSQ